MRRFIAAVLTMVLMPVPRLALADDPAPLLAIPPGDDQIIFSAKGTAAPFDGQLFSNATAQRWGNYLQQAKFRLKADVEHQQKLDQIQIDLLNQKLVLERAQYQTVTADLQKRIDLENQQVQALQISLSSPPWYKTQETAFIIGILSTAALVTVSAYAYHQATK